MRKALLLIIMFTLLLYCNNTYYEKIFSKYYYTKDRKYLKALGKGVRNRNPLALYYTGLIFDKIIGGIKNKKIAKSFYKDSIKEYQKRNDKNIVYPLYALGTLLMEEKKYKEGIKLLNQCSNLNYYKATMYLIRFYEVENFKNYQSFTKKRYELLFNLYKKLLHSKKYYSKALVGLGALYMNIKYNKFRNYDLALKYSLEAAKEFGEHEAYDNLVSFYRYIDSKYKDINKSYHWKALGIVEYITRFNESVEGMMSMPNWE